MRSLLCAVLLLATDAAACELVLEGAWVRAAPPGVDRMAAYVTLRNGGSEDCVITGASSPAFGSAMLHRTVTEDGVSRMRPLGQLSLAAGGSLDFAPGGRHIMLLGPVAPLTATVPVTLHHEQGEVTALFEIREP